MQSPAILRGAETWSVLDDEAEDAVFCADSSSLLDAVRSEYLRLRSDPITLGAILDTVPENDVE